MAFGGRGKGLTVSALRQHDSQGLTSPGDSELQGTEHGTSLSCTPHLGALQHSACMVHRASLITQPPLKNAGQYLQHTCHLHSST